MKLLSHYCIQENTKWIKVGKIPNYDNNTVKALLGNIHIIACDPGTRTVATCYDPQRGLIIEFGNGLATYVDSVFEYKCRKLRSKLSKLELHNADVLCNNSKDQPMLSNTEQEKLLLQENLNKIGKMRIHYLNRHYKTFARFLSNMYHIVVWPPYETSNMVYKRNSISATLTRLMQNLRMYQLAVLIEKYCKNVGTILLRTGEHFTSKCCPKCHKINKHLKGNKIFKCPSSIKQNDAIIRCEYEEGRDAGACRKILIRAIYEILANQVSKNQHYNKSNKNNNECESSSLKRPVVASI